MSANRLTLEPWTTVDDRVELAATLELDGLSHRLWWRVPARWRDALTTWADPFVIGLIFPMMSAGGEVEIVGKCSPSLLANLETFNATWLLWAPDRYKPLRLRATEEVEPPVPPEPDARVTLFSAGVDSCFTAYRNVHGLAGRNSHRIAAGLTLFGFDILTHERNVAPRYEQLRDAAAKMLASLDVPMVELDTNFRSLPQFWRHSHGSQLGSALALFGGRFGGGLLPNTTAYDKLDFLDSRLGSHPLSDPMMSSLRFPISDDGGTHRRYQKIAVIAEWPEAMRDLRVCFGAAGNVGNCGRCEKCFRTAAGFLIAGREPPAGLPRDFSPAGIRHLRPSPSLAISYWRDLSDEVRARGLDDQPWAQGVHTLYGRVRRAWIARQVKRPFLPLRNSIRHLFRGSTMSRKQIAAQRETIAKTS